ncbi:MAG: hypothetical protein IPJ97_18190 [Proteobacteria bacterium]|nr:hypothetical protein [Pseudomonadota bacterium]
MPEDEFPTLDRSQLPALDAAQMREVDGLMTEEYFVDLEQMMENAGRCLAHLARRLYPAAGSPGRPVLVMVGVGGNGGGALAAARRLANWGYSVHVALVAGPARLSGVRASIAGSRRGSAWLAQLLSPILTRCRPMSVSSSTG